MPWSPRENKYDEQDIDVSSESRRRENLYPTRRCVAWRCRGGGTAALPFIPYQVDKRSALPMCLIGSRVVVRVSVVCAAIVHVFLVQ